MTVLSFSLSCCRFPALFLDSSISIQKAVAYSRSDLDSVPFAPFFSLLFSGKSSVWKKSAALYLATVRSVEHELSLPLPIVPHPFLRFGFVVQGLDYVPEEGRVFTRRLWYFCVTLVLFLKLLLIWWFTLILKVLRVTWSVLVRTLR
jgi:hypothetical protein